MATIQLLLDDAGNRAVLSEFLEDRYEVLTGDPEESVDAYVVGDAVFDRYRDELRSIVDRNHPVFTPVLFVTRQGNTPDLEADDVADGAAVPLVDDVIEAPVDRTTLRRRLAALLGRRQQSRQLVDNLETVEQQREQLQLYEKAIMGSTDLIAAVDRDGRYLFVNDRYRSYYDLEEESVTGMRARDVVEEEDYQAIENEPVSFEQTRTLPNGDRRDFNVHRYPIESPSGEIRGRVSALRDVTEQKTYERKLEAQRNKLQVLNQIMRHDIRNDLQMVLAHGQLVREDLETDSARESIETVLSNAEETLEIIETARNVTDMMLREEGQTETVRLDQVLGEEIGDVRSTYDGATVQIRGEIPEVEVRADEMLGAVFRNLLSNGIEHNDDDPTVTVSVTVEDDQVRTEFADNGPGIPNGKKAAMFEEGEMGLDSDGTGLGLYLVDSLVGFYDGNVWIEDNEPRGSVFVVELQKAG